MILIIMPTVKMSRVSYYALIFFFRAYGLLKNRYISLWGYSIFIKILSLLSGLMCYDDLISLIVMLETESRSLLAGKG
jgi:hypothetical protein